MAQNWDDIGKQQKKTDKKLYGTLGISPNATTAEIHHAYKLMSLQLHPDKQTKPLENENAFTDVHNAYSILSNEYSRSVYDQFGSYGIDLLQTKQLSERKLTLDQIMNKLRKFDKQSKSQWFEQNIGLSGVTSLKFHHFSFQNFMQGSSLKEIADISTNQSYKIYAGENTRVKMNFISDGMGEVQEKGKQLVLDAKYLNLMETGIDLFSKGTLAQDPSVSFGGNAPLDSLTSGSQNISYSLRHGLSLSTRVMRKLYLPYFAPPPDAFGRLTRPTSLTGYMEYTTPGELKIGAKYMGLNMSYQYLELSASKSFIVDLSYNLGLYLTRMKDIWLNLILKCQLFTPSDATTYFPTLAPYFSLSGEVHNLINKISSFGIGIKLEVYGGITLIYKYVRMNQTVAIPFNFAETLSFSSMFYSVMLQLLSFLIITFIVVGPYKTEKRLQKLEKKREAIKVKKSDASEWLSQMENSIVSKFHEEKTKRAGGLVLVYACYGNLSKRVNFVPPGQPTSMWINDIPSEEEKDEEIIDVTSALQLLVNNSSLTLPGGLSISSYNGVYDPSPGSDNYIEIFYEFQHKKHRVVSLDKDIDETELKLPHGSHRI